jgi:hypothetical protein
MATKPKIISDTLPFSVAKLTAREARYLRLLTQQASNQKALTEFCKYVGWYEVHPQLSKQHPLQARIARLKQLAAMPNLWSKLK